jgi:phenylacetate-CoA ligase
MIEGGINLFWNQQVEVLSRRDMTAWQSHRVEKVIERVYEKSALYKNRMTERGILPEHITSLDDLERMPFTTRQDVVDNYPYGLLTMPISGVTYIHKAQDKDNGDTAISYTRNDMIMWTELAARMLIAGGVNVTSVFQIVDKPEEHTENLGVYCGLQQIGATLVPPNTGSMTDQIQLIQDFGVTAVFSNAFHLLALAKETEKLNSKSEALHLQNIFCDMQFLSADSVKEIQQIYGIKPVEMYGMYDIWGMGIAGECHCGDGLHLSEDCFYPEVVQPESGQVLTMGQTGELVLTSLALEAMPLIRYRTGILCSLDDRTCACGRTLIRIRKK